MRCADKIQRVFFVGGKRLWVKKIEPGMRASQGCRKRGARKKLKTGRERRGSSVPISPSPPRSIALYLDVRAPNFSEGEKLTKNCGRTCGVQEIFLARTALQQTCATRSKLDRELSKTLSNATLRSMREVCIHDERGKKEWGWKGGGNSHRK